MAIVLSPELRARIGERYNPHCRVWVNVVASLWGMADDHDLDEPVKLTNELPCRLRMSDGGMLILIDRSLSWKTTRPGTHVAARFYFRDGTFHEIDIPGVPSIPRDASCVDLNNGHQSRHA